MRSRWPSSRSFLKRWFAALLHAKYGVLLGVPIAAGLLTLLVYQAALNQRRAVEQQEQARVRIVITHVRTVEQDSNPDFFARVTIDSGAEYQSVPHQGGTGDLWLEPIERGQKFDNNGWLALLYANGDDYVDQQALMEALRDRTRPYVVREAAAGALGELSFDSSGSSWTQEYGCAECTYRRGAAGGGRGMSVDLPFSLSSGYLHASLPITITMPSDGVVTEYPVEMTYNSAKTLMSQVVRGSPSVSYLSALDSFASGTEHRHLMQPIMTGIAPPQSGIGTSLEELTQFFKPDKPIYVVAELDATTFQKEPAAAQRILFNPRLPISFVWNIKPLEEREQDITVSLFLEGTPVNGTELQRIPISSTTVHAYVSVPAFSYGSPIAIYTAMYTVLTFILGGLATWGVPRIYVWVMALYGGGRPCGKPVSARRNTAMTAVVARRYNRKMPGRCRV